MSRNSVLFFKLDGNNYQHYRKNGKELRKEKDIAKDIISLVYDNLSVEQTIIFLDELACLINPVGCREMGINEQEYWIQNKLIGGTL